MLVLFPLAKIPTARGRASGAPAPGGGVPSQRPWATQRPRRDEQRAPRTLGVAPAAHRHQQARATVPWVAPQLEAHVQPGQLVSALGGGPPPRAMARRDRPVPPRTAQPTRRGRRRSQAVRLSWPCGEAGGRARPCRLRAGRVARVGHAETARGRAWAVPPRPAAPGRRVPHRSQAVRSSWPCRAPRGRGHAVDPTHGQNCSR